MICGSARSNAIFAIDIVKQEIIGRFSGHSGPGPVTMLSYINDFGLISACSGDTRIILWPQRDKWLKVKRFDPGAVDAVPPYSVSPYRQLRRPSDKDFKQYIGEEGQPGRAPVRHGIAIYVDKVERVPAADAWVAGGLSDPYLRFRCIEVDGPS